MQSASRITTIALGFSMPALIGFGLDRWLGTMPVATITGAILGFPLGMFQTLRLAREAPGKSSRRKKNG
jgi:F0F1-type ATP synthase assembly protein I